MVRSSSNSPRKVAALLFACCCYLRIITGFVTTTPRRGVLLATQPRRRHSCFVGESRRSLNLALDASVPSSDGNSDPPIVALPPPTLDGNRILPLKIIQAGLSSSAAVPAVYAIFNSNFKPSSPAECWESCEQVGVSMDVGLDLNAIQAKLLEDDGDQTNMSFVRAQSFQPPSVGAMESVADDWRTMALEAGGRIHFDAVQAALEAPLDDDDDDDDYFDDGFNYMDAASGSGSGVMGLDGVNSNEGSSDQESVISPFDAASEHLKEVASTNGETGESMVFNKANVDSVLDEVRPYLISDGGNVSVESVDEVTRNVYLVLEGACGSCPSSTVTMQMGIERVLKEQFDNLGEVIQVQPEGSETTELTLEAVEAEVDRIKPAIMAMGGSVAIDTVDAKTGLVELTFTGASKVRQGLELAIQDIEFVTEVRFL